MIEHIDSNKKTDILVAALSERYSAMHKIRERMENTRLWVLGAMLAIAGWLLQGNVVLGTYQKIICAIGLTLTFVIIRFLYINDLNKGLKTQQRAAVNLEKALGFFDPKFFNEEEKSLYPEEWQETGNAKGHRHIFHSTNLLIYVAFVFLIAITLLN